MNEAMTIEQAAEVYDITAPGIRHLIKQRKLIPHKQDGITLLSKAALESVLFGVCPICGDKFSKGNQRQRFCSQSCRQKASRRA